MSAQLRQRMEAAQSALDLLTAEVVRAEEAASEAMAAATFADRRARLAHHQVALLRAERADLERAMLAAQSRLLTVDPPEPAKPEPSRCSPDEPE